jgi:hypothetical protein
MMTCPVCHSIVPDHLLTCPVCAQRKSDTAMLAAQLEPLRKVLRGEGPLTIRAINGKRHVQMFAGKITFCGLMVDERHRRSFLDWGIDDTGSICSDCLRAVTEAMQQAAPDSAREIKKGAKA